MRLFSEACRDSEAAVRREGLAGLAELGDKAAGTFDLLTGIVRDDIASSVRAAAVDALARVSRKQPERVIELVKKGDHPNVRMGAAVALGTFDASDVRIVEAEAHALGDSESGVRLAALKALGGWKRRSAPASAALARTIRDRDAVEADAALAALRGISDAGSAAVPGLVEVLEGGNAERRERAAAALTAIGRPAVPEVMKRVEEKDVRVAVRFADVLGRMGAAAGDAVPALRSTLQSKDWPRAAASAGALPLIDAGQEPVVASSLIGRLSGARTNVFAECSMVLAGIAGRTKDDATRKKIVTALSKNLADRLTGDAMLAGGTVKSAMKERGP